MTNRRELLWGLSAAAISAACRGRRSTTPHTDDRPKPPRPRSLVLIVMRGGLDAVLSTSPKHAGEVDSWVDVPYAKSDILDHGGQRFGPHLAPLLPVIDRFAIVNNVHVGTVRHETGEPQLLRLRTRMNARVPFATEVIGWYRQGPAIGAISLGGRLWDSFSAGSLDCTTRRIFSGDDKDICDQLAATPPDELRRGAEALERLATSSDAPETRRHSRDVSQLMRRIAETPPFREEEWAKESDPAERMWFGGPQTRFVARDFQRTLWMLEHELTSCISIGSREFEWDSHVDNLAWQTLMNKHFFPLVTRFMQELHRRKNRHGTLAEQTMVVLGSELGRHPRINDHKGKDHFPETTLFLAGPNVKPGVYGATGRRMEGLPVDLATGKADRRGVVPDLDDIGTSVMDAFGIDPLAHGYTGRRLPFLVDV